MGNCICRNCGVQVYFSSFSLNVDWRGHSPRSRRSERNARELATSSPGLDERLIPRRPIRAVFFGTSYFIWSRREPVRETRTLPSRRVSNCENGCASFFIPSVRVRILRNLRAKIATQENISLHGEMARFFC